MELAYVVLRCLILQHIIGSYCSTWRRLVLSGEAARDIAFDPIGGSSDASYAEESSACFL